MTIYQASVNGNVLTRTLDHSKAIEAIKSESVPDKVIGALDALKPAEEFAATWDESGSALIETVEPEDEDEERTVALAQHLEIDLDEVESGWADNEFDTGGLGEFLVLTDDEAQEMAEEYVRQSIWAFRPDFLAHYTPDGIESDTIELVRNGQCEDANDALTALVEAGGSFKIFVEEAIAADGRGHFLSTYDGEEIESGRFFIYRTN